MIREVCTRSLVGLAIPLFVLAAAAAAEVKVWESMGPEGGTILVFAADPSDPETVYAAAEPAAIYRSVDVGASWSRLATLPAAGDATLGALAVDPRNPSILYAAVGQRMHRSENGGATWAALGESSTGEPFASLVALDGSPPTLVAIASTFPRTIQRSTDGGASWSAIELPDEAQPLALTNAGSALYASTTRGVVKSSDRGASWVTSSAGLPAGGYFAIAAAPSSPSTLYVLGDDQQLYRSTDRAASWNLRGHGLLSAIGTPFLAVDALDPALLYILTTGASFSPSAVARSTDTGHSWSLAYDESETALQASTLIATRAARGGLLVGLVSGGVVASRDGGETFDAANDGLRAVSVDLLAVPGRPSPLVYGANSSTLFAHEGEGSDWRLRGLLPPKLLREVEPRPALSDLKVDPFDPSRLQGAAGWHLVTSTDAGNTIKARFGPGCLNARQLAIAPSAPDIRYVSGGITTLGCLDLPGAICALHKSTDGGATWNCLEQAPGGVAIAVDPLDPDIVDVGYVSLYRTTDGGATWTRTQADLDLTDLAIDPLNPSTLYAGTEEKGLWRSIDRGESWQPFAGLDEGLPAAPIAAVVPHPIDPRTLYVSYEGIGIFTSLDRGLSFGPLNSGLEQAAFSGAFAIDSRLPSRLYAGTRGQSVYRLTHEEPAPCEPGERTLCLGGGRFKVQVRWRDFAGRTGPGRAGTLTDDSGYFWFFDSANLELVVKALDARTLNDRFWVFYGSLTNVEFQLVVTDTVTGEVNAYLNPERSFASRGDTTAFPRAEETAVRAVVSARAEQSTAGRAVAFHAIAPRASCAADERTLCLGAGRFRVIVDWTDFRGGTGTGHARPLNETTGTFWFFNEANVEIAIKVLDGRTLNDHFWVFYGALSNVAYRLTVEDTSTGEVRTYVNPSGQFASRGDTAAFLDPVP